MIANNVNPTFKPLNKVNNVKGKKGITADKLKANNNNYTSSPKPITKDVLLKSLLYEVTKLDFILLAHPIVKKHRKELLTLEPDSKEANEIQKQLQKIRLANKHYVVISIDELLSLAKRNNWDLCKRGDFIYCYNGAYWSNMPKDDLIKFTGEVAEKQGVPFIDAKFYLFREQLLKQFLSTAYLPAPAIENNKVLINLTNGTFEINQKGHQLRPFNKNDFLTYQLPFEYNANAKAPMFEKYLNEVLPDVSSQLVLSEYIGYIFTKQLKLEKALLLYGSGANGKSVFFDIITALLGNQNVSNYTLQSITDEKGYQRAMLQNSLVNYGSEISDKLNSDIFKQLVSGEPIEARLPYGQPFEITNYAKLIFNCNQLPKDVEQTNAYFRRFLIIPFDVTISDDNKDVDLAKKIIANELSGVFNWVLDGLNRLLKKKDFTKCDAAKKAVEQYRIESDSVKLFIRDEGYQKSIEEHILLKDLYHKYRIFCNEDGYRPVNKSNFKKRLLSDSYHFEKKNIGNVFYITNKSNVPF